MEKYLHSQTEYTPEFFLAIIDRSGSKSEVAALPRYFCVAPMNGHREAQRPSPFGADSVAKVFLSHRSQIFRAVGAAIEY
jgi:hypothetical protein